MTRAKFCDHIHATRRINPGAHVERLVNRLAKVSPEAIIDFDDWWDVALERAYFWDRWEAAYRINGGCSDDGFTDFHTWLTLQGQVVYEAAVKHPDSLADVVDPDEHCSECECYPASAAWAASTGVGPDDDHYPAMQAAYKARHPERPKARGMGRQWDFDEDAQVRRRLPRLAALYLAAGDD